MEAAVADEEAGMTNWNDRRLDDLNKQVDGIAQRVGEGIVQLNRIDERVEQLGKSMDQVNSRVGRFESQVGERFDRIESQVQSRFNQLESQTDARLGGIESGLNQLNGQFRELRDALVQVAWALAVALLVVLGGVIAAQV